MAVEFAVSDLFRKNIVARALSNTPASTGGVDSWTSATRSDFFNGAKTYLQGLTPDMRAIAGAHDPYFQLYAVQADVHPEWESYLWVHDELRRWLVDLSNPSKILFSSVHPSHWLMGLVDSKDVTFVNNLDLHLFERFVPTCDDYSSYTLQYSAIDPQDILAGEGAGTFDYMDVQFVHLQQPDRAMAKAYAGLLAPGGVMSVVNSGSNKGLYKRRSRHLHDAYEENRGFLDLDGFTVMHFPIDVGFTLIQRDS